jgi:zinc D-Ala-D-Ala carboxypeptidase
MEVPMQLSPHFSFAEMTRTGQSRLQEANRQQAMGFIVPLTAVCVDLLEPIRLQYGPVRVNSGFRGLAVNTAIGGSKRSQHMKGEAADLTVPGQKLEDVFRWIVMDSGIKFGQAILEGRTPVPTWIHISLGAPYRDPKMCGQILRFDGKRYSAWKP